MKKTIIVLLAVLALVLAVAPTAFAATACEQKICELAATDKRIKQVQCVVYQRAAVIAIQTEKFSTRSQYDQYVKQLTASVKETCEIDHVFVTRNPKIMKQIAELSKLDGAQRDEAIQKIIENVMKLHPLRRAGVNKAYVG